jgi:hypothetical protein
MNALLRTLAMVALVGGLSMHPRVARADTDVANQGLTARARCVALVGGVGLLLALPGALPLWVAGASKGLALGQVAMDGVAQMRTPRSVPETSRERFKIEREHQWFLVGSAVLGSVVFTGLFWTPYAGLFTSMLLLMMQSTDGMGSGLCRDPENRPVSRAWTARNLAVAAVLIGLSVVPLPVALMGTAAGLVLIGIGLGFIPQFPLIPGLGPTDLQATFKRAGVMQTSAWVAVYVSGILAAAGVSLVLLEFAPPVRSQPQE